MKSFIHRNPFRWLAILLGGVVLIVSIDIALSRYIENKIHETITSIHGKVTSVHVNLSRRLVTINGVDLASDPDSVHTIHQSMKLKAISAKGISLYDLLINKKIIIEEVLLDSGMLLYTKGLTPHQLKPIHSNFNYIQIKNIHFTNTFTQIKTDSTESFSAILNGQLTDVTLTVDSLHVADYSVKTIDARAEKIIVSRPEEMYSGTIASLHLNTVKQEVIFDSIKFIPNLGKYEFAQHLGKQTARIDLCIPHLTIAGLQFDKLIDSVFVASKIEIKSFDLFVFKDKRIPFLRKENVPLPMVSFLKLPFHVKVDSIVISNSLITIEEFPEHGIKTGTVTFKEVNATLAGLDNRQEGDHAYARLDANALLMGAGKVKALFQLPLDGSSIYTAKGSISNMSFKELNPVLTSMANVRAESGYLKDLAFDFKYNEFTSKGTINIDYENLHLIHLNTNKRSTNELKTFFMNAFVKNERSKSLSPAKKNGVIDIERDRKRYIFNVWWRSILSGLKSSILG